MNTSTESRESPADRRHRQTWVMVAIVAGVLLGAFLSGCGGELARAKSLDEQGDLAAVAVYAAILETSPDDIDALNGLAVDLMFLQKYDQALPVQEHLIALDHKDLQTRVELGFNYLNHQDRPGDAVRVLTEATELDPSAQRLTFLAQAQRAAGDVKGAESTLRRALDVDPGYAHSYSVLRDLLLEAGRTQDAGEVGQLAQTHGVQIEGAQ